MTILDNTSETISESTILNRWSKFSIKLDPLKLENKDEIIEVFNNLENSKQKELLSDENPFLKNYINKIKRANPKEKDLLVTLFIMGLKKSVFARSSKSSENKISIEKSILKDFIKTEIEGQKLVRENELLIAYDNLSNSDIKILMNKGLPFLRTNLNKIKNYSSQEDKNIQATLFIIGLKRKIFDPNSDINKRT